MLAKSKADQPAPPKHSGPPVRRYMDPKHIRKKLLGTPSFYLSYWQKVYEVMRQQGIGHSDEDGFLTKAELDRMDAYAEQFKSPESFVEEVVKPSRGV